MELRKIIINNNEYLFTNEFASNRMGFRHITRLFKNDYEIGKYSCQYYNRTWESYDYQSVMRGCINDIIDKALKLFISEYKEKNNVTRLTKEKRELVEKNFYNNEDIKELKQVYDELQYSR